jgi:hypothetical protein
MIIITTFEHGSPRFFDSHKRSPTITMHCTANYSGAYLEVRGTTNHEISCRSPAMKPYHQTAGFMSRRSHWSDRGLSSFCPFLDTDKLQYFYRKAARLEPERFTNEYTMQHPRGFFTSTAVRRID